jgi:hypothetical protein
VQETVKMGSSMGHDEEGYQKGKLVIVQFVIW